MLTHTYSFPRGQTVFDVAGQRHTILPGQVCLHWLDMGGRWETAREGDFYIRVT